jgi:hypothetical protein
MRPPEQFANAAVDAAEALEQLLIDALPDWPAGPQDPSVAEWRERIAAARGQADAIVGALDALGRELAAVTEPTP